MSRVNISDLQTSELRDNLLSFKNIYEENKKHVFAISLSILKDTELAEDVMQEAFIKLFQYMKENEISNVKAWLLSVARNTALDLYRKRKQEIIGIRESHFEKAYFENPIERLVLKKYLEILNLNERQIVFLKDISGMKHREIANMLEMPLGTVLWKYRKALKKLKKDLEEVK
ncbi:RNA polymerase sigma factor [Gracilibacillus sp. D59]|uniref:RNA polymerase sigma factor n=1 Tax=Gracilibacillus sp. D59 TaxID=3457434 RepID=UPI003FCE2ED3